MSDRKKVSRVQGAWASANNSKASTSVFSTENKDKGKQLVYQEDSQIVKKEKPVDIYISEDGVYDLSTTENGKSTVRLIRNFFDTENADWIYEQLKTELPWEKRFNKELNFEEPRLISWIGEYPYSYSGVEWPALAFTPLTEMIRDRLYEKLNYKFNSVLANFYRDCKDHVSWHSDDEPMLGKDPFIASLSFGDLRMFEMRRKLNSDATNKDYEYVQHVKIPLTHGSLLIMEGATQNDWQHQVPKEYHDRDGRINLTYRKIYPS